jgi:hypothetical protein
LSFFGIGGSQIVGSSSLASGIVSSRKRMANRVHSHNHFFIIGPLRTGSSLMARCIDDHPGAICLCESEINRALFQDYYVRLHAQRMEGHGLSSAEVFGLLDGRKQDDVPALLSWYGDVRPRMAGLLEKPHGAPIGDKSPDYFQSPEIVEHFASSYQLIYTVRDPRAIFQSIEAQANVAPRLKVSRWQNLVGNYLAWRRFLGNKNILIVRYEDVVRQPETTMRGVYSHLGLPYSGRFLEPFARKFPKRFLWTTAIDWETGVKKDFDVTRIDDWKTQLSADDLRFISNTPYVGEFMERFGYEREKGR